MGEPFIDTIIGKNSIDEATCNGFYCGLSAQPLIKRFFSVRASRRQSANSKNAARTAGNHLRIYSSNSFLNMKVAIPATLNMYVLCIFSKNKSTISGVFGRPKVTGQQVPMRVARIHEITGSPGGAVFDRV